MKYNFRRKHLEAYFWIFSILLLAMTNPEEAGHWSLCPIQNMGWDFCPGCGLGHSISWLFRGQFATSVSCHPLGTPAVLILLTRSFTLLKSDIHIEYKFNLKNKWNAFIK